MSDNLRKFMMLVEDSVLLDIDDTTETDFELDEKEVDVVARLEEIVFRLRAHQDNTGGDYSFGFESALEMAAEMVENLLTSLKESEK